MVKKIPRRRLHPKPEVEPNPKTEVRVIRRKINKTALKPQVRPCSEADEKRIQELFDQGIGCAAIARELGVRNDTVSQWAKRLGIDWVDTPKRALEAIKARNEVSKAELKTDMLKLAKKFMNRMGEDEYTLVYAGPHRTRTDVVAHAPGFEARDLTTAARNLLACIEKIEEFERSREQGTSSVDKFLQNLSDDEEE
jgi:DNA-binding transcriptional regulator YdaS (Cro superfamily)